jgi:hypothetical protein
VEAVLRARASLSRGGARRRTVDRDSTGALRPEAERMAGGGGRNRNRSVFTRIRSLIAARRTSPYTILDILRSQLAFSSCMYPCLSQIHGSFVLNTVARDRDRVLIRGTQQQSRELRVERRAKISDLAEIQVLLYGIDGKL